MAAHGGGEYCTERELWVDYIARKKGEYRRQDAANNTSDKKGASDTILDISDLNELFHDVRQQKS